METPGLPTINFSNYPLKEIPSPHPHDVLCGRGGGTNNHVGNSHWRMLVAANKQLYVSLPKRQKMLLSRSIVNAVRSQNPPGRFLQKDAKSELWYDVGDQRAQEKTSQALREGAPDIRQKLQKGGDSTDISTASSTGTDTKTPPHPTQKSPAPPASSNGPVPAPSPQQTMASPGMMNSFMPGQNPANTGAVGIAGMGAVPPGSTPIVVYMPNQQMAQMNGMNGMQMFPMMANQMNGMMMSGMPNFPPPVPPQIPSQKPSEEQIGDQAGAPSDLMPPPSVRAPTQVTSNTDFQSTVRFQGKEGNAKTTGEEDPEDTVPEMISGGLEPVGISIGSISMTDYNGKLEPAGTSFGSMMSFSVAGSKIPDMVDGGLEGIGTSFGSLSIKTDDKMQLQDALHPDPIPKLQQKTFATPTLLSQQKSTGNLLECSDTDEEDEDDEVQQGAKSAEWEKLKAMLEQHTSTEQGNSSGNQAMPPPPQPSGFDQLPHTGFDRDFSNISALSVDFGDFDHSPAVGDVNDARKSYNNNDAGAMPPPPSMAANNDDDDDSLSEREKLIMMLSAQNGGNFGSV